MDKIHMDSEKLISSFDLKKNGSPNFLLNNYSFCNLLITFRHYYYAKYMFLTLLTLGEHTFLSNPKKHARSI